MQNSVAPEMRNRQAIMGVALVGIGAMAIVSLLQTGIVRHLPDPPVGTPHFDSDKVHTTEEAFGYGMPDGPLTLAAHATMLAPTLNPGIELRGIIGLRHIDMVRRYAVEEGEFDTTMWFDNLASVRNLVGNHLEVAHVPAAARAFLSRFDVRAYHSEVFNRRKQEASA